MASILTKENEKIIRREHDDSAEKEYVIKIFHDEGIPARLIEREKLNEHDLPREPQRKAKPDRFAQKHDRVQPLALNVLFLQKVYERMQSQKRKERYQLVHGKSAK